MPSSTNHVVTISRRGAERLRAGHVWVYRSDIVEAKDVLPGALVLVQELSDKSVRPTRAGADPKGPALHTGGRGPHSTSLRAGPPHTRVLGSALYSTASEIAVRMIREETDAGGVEQVLFVCFNEEAERAYEKATG